MKITDIKVGQIVKYDNEYAFVFGICADALFDMRIMTDNMQTIPVYVYELCKATNKLYMESDWFFDTLKNMMTTCLENEFETTKIHTWFVDNMKLISQRAQTERVTTWLMKNKLVNSHAILTTCMSTENFNKIKNAYLKQKGIYLKKAQEVFYKGKTTKTKELKSGQVYFYNTYLVIYLTKNKYMVFPRETFDEDAFLLMEANSFYWNRVKRDLHIDDLQDLNFNIFSIEYNKKRIKQIFSDMGFVQ